MVKIIYEIVPHDGGWAYRLGGVYSEAFPTHDQALEAAQISAELRPELCRYQDESGRWREEYSDGGDRPEVEIIDSFADDDRPQA